MIGKQKARIICDGIILIVSAFLALEAEQTGKNSDRFWIQTGLALICGMAAVFDLFYQYVQLSKSTDRENNQRVQEQPAIREVILLDEQNKPVKSWDIAGKTSVVVGRKGGDEEIDVDLEDCEYGTFVDPQHAALNYCLDGWYLEDLGSTNGVSVQKAEDGNRYKVTGRPCRVTAGDILYIANIRLLLT